MKKQQSGLGISSMAIGIISLLVSCTGLGLIGIIGIIFSIIVLSKKNNEKGMPIAGLATSILAVLVSTVMIMAETSLLSNNSNFKTTDIENVSEEVMPIDEIENRKEASNREGEEMSDADFEIKEYMYENTIGDTIFFVAIKNNSKENVSASANATAKDSSGNAIGAGDMSIDIIGTGETSIGYFYFDGITGIDKIEYKIDYDNKPYYNPVINNLSVEQTLNEENVILSVTNNSDKPALFVEAYVLFMDSENNILNYDSNYITDDDSEIKPKETISAQFDSYGEYDHVEIYYTGRAEK